MKQHLLDVLHKAYKQPFRIQSDYSRWNSREVSQLASIGYLSTVEAPGSYGRTWRVTGLGIQALKNARLL